MPSIIVILNDAPPAPPSAAELARLAPVIVPVRRLVAAFACNELAGEREYARKRLVVLGRVGWVRRAPGGIVLRLVSPSGGAGVRCFFTEEHAEALTGLGRGEEVAVTGVYVGLEGREVRVVGLSVHQGGPLAVAVAA